MKGNFMPEKTYDVHLYALVRLKVCDVKAGRQIAAIRKAEKDVDMYAAFDVKPSMQSGADDMEFAEETLQALVAVVGDKEYVQTRWYRPAEEGWAEGKDG